MTFARKEDRQEEHQAADEGRRPSVTQTVVSKVRIEGHVAGKGQGTEVIGEDPETLQAAIVGATLDIDGEETREENGRDDQQEDGERSPDSGGVVMNLFGLLLHFRLSGGFRRSDGGLLVESLTLGGGLGLGDGLLHQRGLHGGFLRMGTRLGQSMGHVVVGADGDSVEDDPENESVDGKAEAAEGLGKVQREAHGAKPQPRSPALSFNSKLGN